MAQWHQVSAVAKEIIAKLATKGTITIVSVTPGEQVIPGQQVEIQFDTTNTDTVTGKYFLRVDATWWVDSKASSLTFDIMDQEGEIVDTGQGQWDSPEYWLAAGNSKRWILKFVTPEELGKAYIQLYLFAWY